MVKDVCVLLPYSFFGDKYYDIKKQQMKWAQRYYIYTSK